MMESGEPYMMMEKTEAAKPQKSFLILPSNAKTDTKATAVKAPIANANKPPIFPFSFFPAYTMNTITYINSITAPVPFIVDTNILCGDTNGNPYLYIILQQIISFFIYYIYFTNTHFQINYYTFIHSISLPCR